VAMLCIGLYLLGEINMVILHACLLNLLIGSLLIVDILFAKILLSSDRTPNLVNQNAAERFTKSLSIPIGFLLFTFNYHSKKRKLFAIGIILIDLLLTIYRARRGLVFICSITIVFSFLLYLVLSRTKLLIVVFSIYKFDSGIPISFAIIILVIAAFLTSQKADDLVKRLAELSYWFLIAGIACILINFYRNKTKLNKEEIT